MKLLSLIGLSVLLSYGVVEAGEKHKPGDTWPKSDGCNTCEMDQYGTSYCTTLYCRDRADCLRTGSDGTVYNICRMPDLSKILDFDVSQLPQELVTCDPDMTKCETPCEREMKR